jgi:hypothetical protein
MQIDVVGGDFISHPKSRFSANRIVLFAPPIEAARSIKYKPSDLAAFRVDEGWWQQPLDEIGDWAAALAAAGAAGTTGTAANMILPQFFPGQRAIVTWANAVIGGAAATAALKSRRRIRFKARFNDGQKLIATAEERTLTSQIPRLLSATLSARI